MEKLRSHAIECYPQECVGVIIDNTYIPKENTHNDPINSFSLSEKDSLELSTINYALIHSHTCEKFTEDPRTPSHEDMLGQKNTDVPWGIIHCDGQNISQILWIEDGIILPLLRRKYIPNVTDCFTLARDYYRINYNIDFGTHPRPPNWEEWNPYYIEQNYLKQGFYEVQEPQVGDILLFNIASHKINHIGVYIGNNRFLHHLYARESCEDVSLSKWHKQLKKILRYKL
jgi:proteasome lid subunit RPN8/RPN11